MTLYVVNFTRKNRHCSFKQLKNIKSLRLENVEDHLHEIFVNNNVIISCEFISTISHYFSRFAQKFNTILHQHSTQEHTQQKSKQNVIPLQQSYFVFCLLSANTTKSPSHSQYVPFFSVLTLSTI